MRTTDPVAFMDLILIIIATGLVWWQHDLIHAIILLLTATAIKPRTN